MPDLRICGRIGPVLALVSTTTTSEIGSPPRLKCVIFCGTPLSVIRKSDSSRLFTISPFSLRTVTGVFTSTVRTLMVDGSLGRGAPGSSTRGPAGACARAHGSENALASTAAAGIHLCFLNYHTLRRSLCIQFDAAGPKGVAANPRPAYNRGSYSLEKNHA